MKYKEKLIETVPEFVPDEYFSVISLKRAVWQYLIDHSKVIDDEGMIRFNFYLPSEKEFWWRVKSRDEGKFKRLDLVDFHEKAQKKHTAVVVLRKKAEKYDRMHKHNLWWESKIKEKRLKGKWWERISMNLALFLNKSGRRINNKILGVK